MSIWWSQGELKPLFEHFTRFIVHYYLIFSLFQNFSFPFDPRP